MHGLGLPVGSDIELLKFDDGLPYFCKLSLSTIIYQYIIVSTVIFGIYTILWAELQVQLSNIHYYLDHDTRIEVFNRFQTNFTIEMNLLPGIE